MTAAARRLLLAILVLGALGIMAELLLINHIEDPWQWIPLGLGGATLLMSAAMAFKPTPTAIRLFQLVMLLMIVSGAVGIYLHYGGATEFQLEMDPALRGFALFKKAIVAKAPPALAPGAMTQLGLIGLAYTLRHPALGSGRNL